MRQLHWSCCVAVSVTVASQWREPATTECCNASECIGECTFVIDTFSSCLNVGCNAALLWLKLFCHRTCTNVFHILLFCFGCNQTCVCLCFVASHTCKCVSIRCNSCSKHELLFVQILFVSIPIWFCLFVLSRVTFVLPRGCNTVLIFNKFDII